MKYRDVVFNTDDGLKLSGWMIPSTAAEPKAAILVCHGAGANRTDVLDRAGFLSPAGYHCLLFDFRGHGLSDGYRVSYGHREVNDVRAALDTLEKAYPNLPVAILAQSMGASSVILAAKRCPEVKVFVLDSPFATLWEMARENFKGLPNAIGIPLQHAVGFWGSLFAGCSIFKISPQDVIETLEPRPVLFIHGEADNFIPFEHTVRLHGMYKGPKELWTIPDVPHAWAHKLQKPAFERRVLAFLESRLLPEI